MGSVQSFGDKCPVCGHLSLASDYYYKTGEEYLSCRCCGWRSSREWARNEDRSLKTSLAKDLSLAESAIYAGEPAMDGDGNVVSLTNPVRLGPDTDQAALDELIRDGFHARIFVLEDGRYDRIAGARFSRLLIEDGRLKCFDPELIEKESGGYGTLVVGGGDTGFEAVYSLTEPSDAETVFQGLSEEDRKNVLHIAAFASKGKDPTFHGIAEQEWLERYDEAYMNPDGFDGEAGDVPDEAMA